METRVRWPRLHVLMLICGVAILGYTLSGLIRVRGFLANADQADGIVVDIHPAPGAGRSGQAIAVVRYVTESGATVDWASRATAGYARGDRVPVLYRVDAPEAAIVGRLWTFYGRFLLLLAVGMVLAMGGLGRMRAR